MKTSTKKQNVVLGSGHHVNFHDRCQNCEGYDPCEICDAPVKDPGEHWKQTKEREDGFWSCHPDSGKWRCARCEHLWKPKRRVKGQLPKCPSCGEDLDVFWADDGGWEKSNLSVCRDADDY